LGGFLLILESSIGTMDEQNTNQRGEFKKKGILAVSVPLTVSGISPLRAGEIDPYKKVPGLLKNVKNAMQAVEA
jgi:hypothetical protein